MNQVYTVLSTVGGAGITVPVASGLKFGGFFVNGSAGGETITVKDSATTILTTSAAANAFIPYISPTPVRLTQIVATCSGTGFISVFFTT